MDIGFHIKKGSHDSLEEAIRANVEKYSLTTAQIFLFGPRNMKQNEYDVDELQSVISETKLRVCVHGSYLLSPWSLKKSAIGAIVRELEAAQAIGAKWLVFHLTSRIKHEEIILTLCKIKRAVKNKMGKSSVILLLEHKAHKPYDDNDLECTTSAEGLNHIAHLMIEANMTPESDILPVGLCLDTAHIFVSNTHNTLEKSSMAQQFINVMGPEASGLVCVVHFNGSFSKRGTGKDKHAIPFCEDDRIWSDESSGAEVWIKKFGASCVFIIEHNRGTKTQLKYALKKSREIFATLLA